MFELRLSNSAEKELRFLPSNTGHRIEQLFGVLCVNPLAGSVWDIQKVSGRADTYRIRIGAYRVIYRVYWVDHVVAVFRIERKSDNTYR